jgi:hypothetical protein
LAAPTTARVRPASRERSGAEAEPPAHQDTEPPDAEKACTAATSENGPAPSPSGPKATKQRTKDGGTEPGTADSSAASAPEQQPTAKEAPEAARSDATRTTKAEPGAGKAREPATATTPGSLNTERPQRRQRGHRRQGRASGPAGKARRQGHLDRESRNRQAASAPDRRAGVTGTDPHPPPARRNAARERRSQREGAERHEQASRGRQPARAARQSPASPHPTAGQRPGDYARAARGTQNRNKTSHKHPQNEYNQPGAAAHRRRSGGRAAGSAARRDGRDSPGPHPPAGGAAA